MEPQKDMRSMEQSEMSNLSNNEVDIIDLIKALWRGKWLIIASTVIFALGSILFALSQPNIYQADALLAPTETSNGGGLSKMAGQFGGLAALAGVNLS
ncbi:LPS O-antigen length regulator, partial [Vibrio parahaemolyticus]